MSGEAAADGRGRLSEVAAMVGEFRRRPVLVPLHDDGGLMSAEPTADTRTADTRTAAEPTGAEPTGAEPTAAAQPAVDEGAEA